VVAAALLGGLLLGGLGYWALSPPTHGTNPSPPEALWSPPGWEPSEAAGTVTLPDGKQYHRQLTRSVGGEVLTAIAVAPAREADPPLFYMTRDKITNRAFRAAWDRADADPGSSVGVFRRNYGDQAESLLPGEWRKGAFDIEGNNLGIDGAQQSVPVVNVTLPEAGLVAEELGGRLPTRDQWAKAVGVRGDDPARTSPAGDPPHDFGGAAPKGLALGLDRGPWPVGRATPDVSVHGLHQLISNGYEWTRETSDGQVVNLFSPPLLRPRMAVVGQTWELRTVHTFVGIATGLGKSYPWDDAKSGVGFRIVLEPR
jgi:formylglycine-generating enzyme required for sulfatase activity